MAKTEARWPRKCGSCGEQINEGDEIDFDEDSGEWVHVEDLEDDA